MSKSRPVGGADAADEVLRLASDLGLGSVPSMLPKLLGDVERAACSYTEFTTRLLRAEWDARRERRVTRALKRARLGTVEGLDDYDFSCRPRLEAPVVRELLNCRWAEERRNVIGVGRPGTGKTRVLKALGRAACLKGYTVLVTGGPLCRSVGRGWSTHGRRPLPAGSPTGVTVDQHVAPRAVTEVDPRAWFDGSWFPVTWSRGAAGCAAWSWIFRSEATMVGAGSSRGKG